MKQILNGIMYDTKDCKVIAQWNKSDIFENLMRHKCGEDLCLSNGNLFVHHWDTDFETDVKVETIIEFDNKWNDWKLINSDECMKHGLLDYLRK